MFNFYQMEWGFRGKCGARNCCRGSHIVHRPPKVSRNSELLLMSCKSFTSPNTPTIHLFLFCLQLSPLLNFFSFLWVRPEKWMSFSTKSCLVHFEHSSSYHSEAEYGLSPHSYTWLQFFFSPAPRPSAWVHKCFCSFVVTMPPLLSSPPLLLCYSSLAPLFHAHCCWSWLLLFLPWHTAVSHT